MYLHILYFCCPYLFLKFSMLRVVYDGDAGKSKFSYIIDRNVNWYKLFAISNKI